MFKDLPEDFSLEDPKFDAALNEIAILADVPDACARSPAYSAMPGVWTTRTSFTFHMAVRPGARTKRDSFRTFMRGKLKEACLLHLNEVEIISAFPTWAAVDSDLENTRLAADSLANRLKPADEARSHTREQLQLHLIASRSPVLEQLHDDDLLGAITEILGEVTKACSAARCFLQKTKDDPATSVGYQITNTQKYLGAKCVIRSLIIASEKMGTRLTFSRGPYDVEGPLIEAISILKKADKFFSTGFFPEKLRKLCEDVRSELNRE